MKRDIVTSAIAIIVFTVLLGLVYPLVITGVSQVAFPGNANGQKVYVRGRLVGSKIIGQSFARPVIGKNGKPEESEEELVTEPDPRYFQSRPSATEGGAYNAAASTFSNRGPNSVKTEEANAENIKAYLELNTAPNKQPYDPGLTVAKIPVDAVNTSASNLDPEISQANAWIQAHRIAAVRRLPLARVNGLIAQYTDARGLGFSGERGVNVLMLNLALDRLAGGGKR
jgi:potassium-transporting ATPase KdpC subunit